jgi:hypothetical protein
MKFEKLNRGNTSTIHFRSTSLPGLYLETVYVNFNFIRNFYGCETLSLVPAAVEYRVPARKLRNRRCITKDSIQFSVLNWSVKSIFVKVFINISSGGGCTVWILLVRPVS